MPAPLTPSRLGLAVATALLTITGTAQAQDPVLQLISSDLRVGFAYPQHVQTTDQQGTVHFYERAVVDWPDGQIPLAGRAEWSMKPGSSGLGWYGHYFEGYAASNNLYFDIISVQLRLNEDARVRFSWYGLMKEYVPAPGTYGVSGARLSGTGLPDSGFAINDNPGEKTIDLKAGDYALSTVPALDVYCTSCDIQYFVGLEVLEVISTPVPEPSTVALGLLGLGVVAARARRRSTTH